jgi:hypothetical protein
MQTMDLEIFEFSTTHPSFLSKTTFIPSQREKYSNLLDSWRQETGDLKEVSPQARAGKGLRKIRSVRAQAQCCICQLNSDP